jgi:hypothetical protein
LERGCLVTGREEKLLKITLGNTASLNLIVGILIRHKQTPFDDSYLDIVMSHTYTDIHVFLTGVMVYEMSALPG